MMSFHVKIHKWIDGVLETIEHEYHKLEHAVESLFGLDCDHAKVYDHQGRCVHEHRPHHGHGGHSYSGHDE